MPVDIKELVWVVVTEGIVIVTGEVHGERFIFWEGIASRAEGMLGIVVSIDETYIVEILDGDDETIEVSPATDKDTEQIEGIWNGVLTTVDTSYVGIGISIEIGIINSGRHVASL